MPRSLVLALDLGTTASRAGLLDARGRLVGLRAMPAPPAAGDEASAEGWWDAAVSLSDALAADAGAPAWDGVRAVAATGATRTQVLLDAALRPVRPALLWTDARSAAALDGLAAPDHPEGAALNPYHPAARLLWLRRAEPAALDAAACVVEPKDFVAARLTGRAASDTVASARLAAAAAPGRAGGASLLALLGLPESLVPPLLAPGAVIAPVRAGLPGALGRLAGRPAVALGTDTWTAALGLGALRDGGAYLLSGTTDVLGLVSLRAAAAPGLVALPWGGGLHHLGGPMNCGGGTAAWAARALGLADATTLDALAATARPGPPLFLPHLAGERAPFWNPALRGAWVGLSAETGPAAMALAVLAGVAFNARLVLERTEAALGRRADALRLGGGGASAPWAGVRADVLGRTVLMGAAPEPGLLGAAIAAWTALGGYADMPAAQGALVPPPRPVRPDPAHSAAWDGLFPAWSGAVEALRAVPWPTR